ncbi:MAG TPA: YCF48-related protein, partial [Pyrinomonadaceae bacterium]|nr:YCF48-related protein [Pyrinomonadaceae bacterium]
MCAKAPETARARARLVCLACVVVCAAASIVVAQQAAQPWLWQNPLPQGNAIYAVRFAADKHTGWAVGADGVILRTVDGGFRWEEQHALTNAPLYGLFVRDARVAVAVGARGQALT